MISSRSSCSQLLFKIGVLKDFANLPRKNLCWNLFLIKLQASRPETLLKRDSNAGFFLRNLWIFKKNTLLYRTPPLAVSVAPQWLMHFTWTLIYRWKKIITDLWIFIETYKKITKITWKLWTWQKKNTMWMFSEYHQKAKQYLAWYV